MSAEHDLGNDAGVARAVAELEEARDSFPCR